MTEKLKLSLLLSGNYLSEKLYVFQFGIMLRMILNSSMESHDVLKFD